MLQRSEWLDLHLHLLADGPRHQSVRPLALGQDPEAVLAEQVHDGDGVMLGLLAARLLVHVPQLRRHGAPQHSAAGVGRGFHHQVLHGAGY